MTALDSSVSRQSHPFAMMLPPFPSVDLADSREGPVAPGALSEPDSSDSSTDSLENLVDPITHASAESDPGSLPALSSQPPFSE
jgi:hypothetical protein